MAADSRFLSLPRELRNIIYSYLVPVRGYVIFNPRPKSRRFRPPRRATAILCVSRQVNEEAKDVLYRSKKSPPLTINLGNMDKAIPHPTCDSFEAILPRTPVLEAREIRVVIEIYPSDNVVPDLPRREWHLSEEARHEKELFTCCLLPEVIHMISILRERDELPILSIHFSLYPWLDPQFDIMQAVRQLLKPVAQLRVLQGACRL
ncbi:hypothetical protein SLS58_002829 [Diplodia intermedia]|uniref:Uncharacterized protein n=1 Tax=Diplodia intermedia TaxID=856260 RepID=A0ABR3TYJ1_9PEZI